MQFVANLWFFLPLGDSSHNSQFLKELAFYACQEGSFTITRVVFLNLYPKNVSVLFYPGLFPRRKQAEHFSFSPPLNQARPQGRLSTEERLWQRSYQRKRFSQPINLNKASPLLLSQSHPGFTLLLTTVAVTAVCLSLRPQNDSS